MPEISRFFGVVIAMYYNDHTPPHFHARYGGQHAIIDIETLGILDGNFTPRVLGFVTEWAAKHQEELRENWYRARQNKLLESIEPLE